MPRVFLSNRSKGPSSVFKNGRTIPVPAGISDADTAFAEFAVRQNPTDFSILTPAEERAYLASQLPESRLPDPFTVLPVGDPEPMPEAPVAVRTPEAELARFLSTQPAAERHALWLSLRGT